MKCMNKYMKECMKCMNKCMDESIKCMNKCMDESMKCMNKALVMKIMICQCQNHLPKLLAVLEKAECRVYS